MKNSEKEEAYRSLPHSLGSEKSILSIMMNDGSKVDLAIELGITEDSFYTPAHTRIFRRLYECTKKGIPIDLISLSQHFKDEEILEHLGGNSYISEIYTYQPTSANYEHFIKLVSGKEKLRDVISKCTEGINEAYENPEDVDEFLDKTENKIFSIQKSISKDDIVKSDILIEESIDDFERFVKGESEIEGLPTRFKEFNDLTRGLKGGDMIVIAARPSVGKTALLCNLVEDLMVDNIPGLVFTCEMTNKQFMNRILYGRARFPMHYLKKGYLPTREDIRGLQNAIHDLSKKNLFIDDTSSIRIDAVRSKTRRKKKEEDIKYFAVDYLQLMTGSKKYEGREKEITEISSGLKALSKELGIPGIILAQLNRGPEKRQEGIPRMSDLRESGAIEQDADIVGLLYRPDYYKDDEDEDEDQSKKYHATLIIEKNRNGPTGEVVMKFQKNIMQFF